MISRKAWPFWLFLAFTVAAASEALDRIDRLGRAADQGRETPFALASSLLEAHTYAYQLQTALHELVISGKEPPAMAESERRLDAALAVAIAPHIHSPSVLAPLFSALADWTDTRYRISELVGERRWADAHVLMNSDGERDFHKLHASINRILDAERLRTARLAEETRAAEWDVVVAAIALAVTAGGILAGIAVAFALFARNHRPLMRLRGCLLALAEGESKIDIPYRDQAGTVGAMARAISIFRQSLADRDAAILALNLSREHLNEAIAEARRADECKGRFLASASHDLRQPIQALRLFLDVLDSRLTTTGDRLVLSGALKALAAGEDVLRDYLDLSLLEAGVVQPSLGDVAIGTLLAELVAECAPAAAAKHLTLRTVPCAALVRSDAHLLRRLLRNLLVNATRYTAGGGVLIGCRRRGAAVRIEVWDSGIGIPADKLAAVFEDFFQIGNPERDRSKGLGLGLSVVSRISRLLGHPVEVASRPGQGSVFAVTVPLAAATRLAARAA